MHLASFLTVVCADAAQQLTADNISISSARPLASHVCQKKRRIAAERCGFMNYWFWGRARIHAYLPIYIMLLLYCHPVGLIDVPGKRSCAFFACIYWGCVFYDRFPARSKTTTLRAIEELSNRGMRACNKSSVGFWGQKQATDFYVFVMLQGREQKGFTWRGEGRLEIGTIIGESFIGRRPERFLMSASLGEGQNEVLPRVALPGDDGATDRHPSTRPYAHQENSTAFVRGNWVPRSRKYYYTTPWYEFSVAGSVSESPWKLLWRPNCAWRIFLISIIDGG